MASLDSLGTLLEEELKDIYDAEKQLTKALPKLAKKASASDLRQAFEEHLRQTEQHVQRLEEVFEQLEMPARGKKCVGMQNLIKEGDEMIADAEDDATRDAAMIAGAQKVEHYEIAAYGTVRTWASVLGKSEVASLLEETLEEEKETDQRLSEIAENFVNTAAANKGAEEEQEEGEAEEGGGSTGRPPANVSRGGASAKTRHQAADIGRSRRTTNRSRSKSR